MSRIRSNSLFILCSLMLFMLMMTGLSAQAYAATGDDLLPVAADENAVVQVADEGSSADANAVESDADGSNQVAPTDNAVADNADEGATVQAPAIELAADGAAGESVAENPAAASDAADSIELAAAEPTEPESLATENDPEKLVDGVYTIASAIRDTMNVEIGGASNANGAATNIYANNATPAQRWRITGLADGFYKIINIATGKALDVSGANAYNGARVQQWTDNGTDAQKWAIVSTSEGYRIYSKLSNGFVLDLAGADTSNGSVVQLYESNNTKAQRWVLTQMGAILPNGVYDVRSKVSGKDLDVAGGAIANGSNIQQYAPNGTLAQQFYFLFNDSDGYYTVVAANSGLALDVNGGGDYNGANVQLYTSNNTRAQKWAITKNGDGTYTLRSALGGRALDVSGASTRDGANVQTWAHNNTNAQRWVLGSIDGLSIPEGVYNIITAVNQANSLAVAGSSREEGASVQTAATANSSWAQKWVITNAGEGYYRLRNLNSLMMLDAAASSSGSDVNQSAQATDDLQLWKPEVSVGGVIFRSKANNDVVLDITGASKSAGANVQLYADNNSIAQKFILRAVSAIDSNRTYTIVNVGSGKALDIASASKDNGAALQLYELNNTAAQKFRVVSAGNGSYYLQNISSSKFADVDTNTKTVLQQWEGQSGTNKQWKLNFDVKTGQFTITSVYTGKFLDGKGGTLTLQDEWGSNDQLFTFLPISFKIYLDAGHGWGSSYPGKYDSGATGNGYEEAALTADLTDRILKICVEEFGLEVVDGKTFQNHYSERTHKAEELGCTALLSIHFNASDSTGSGYMAIVGGASKRNANSMALTEIMHNHLGSAMGTLHDYGISVRDDLAIPNNSNMPATLLEVCFIDNKTDMTYYMAHRDEIARHLAEGVLEASARGEFN